jgi:uncharacterized caspase-like protein
MGRDMKVRLPFCLGLALLAATLTCPALAQQSSARVALVIGNASYPGAGTPPANTVEDARTLAEELGRSGFDVELEEDVGKVEMERAIDAFMGRIRSGTAALFYFGGYGIQVARQSYLIPVNAQIWAQPHVRRDGIGLDAVLAEMDRRGAKAKIVIVDAARRNPFERRFRKAGAGLAAVSAPAGTLVMYAAAPGKVIRDGTGANSLFMGELIKELRVPNSNGGSDLQSHADRRVARIQLRAGSLGGLVARGGALLGRASGGDGASSEPGANDSRSGHRWYADLDAG